MIAVISSGDHEGPQPPDQQSVAVGTSSTSMFTVLVMTHLRRSSSRLPADIREHTPRSLYICPHRPYNRSRRDMHLRGAGSSHREGIPCVRGIRVTGRIGRHQRSQTAWFHLSHTENRFRATIPHGVFCDKREIDSLLRVSRPRFAGTMWTMTSTRRRSGGEWLPRRGPVALSAS